MDAETVQFLIIHHSAGPSPSSESDALLEMQEIYDYHTGPQKGWADVGYNFFVDAFGRVFEGRSGSLEGPIMPDATGGNQGFSQTVCVLGDYTDALPTPQSSEALTKLLAWLADTYQLATGPDATTSFESRGSNLWPAGETVNCNTIVGHRDMSQTACPGDRLYPVVSSDLPGQVAALRANTAPSNTNGSSATETTLASTTDPATATTTAPTTPSVGSQPATPTPDGSIATTTTLPTATVPLTTAPGSPTATSSGSVPASLVGDAASAPSNSTASLFAIGALGGTGAVAVLGGLAWVINRRNQNARRPE